jgi:hypothetical protein
MDPAFSLAFGPEQVPLSVLDLAPVPDGGNAGDALRATTDLPGTPSGSGSGGSGSPSITTCPVSRARPRPC